MALCSGNPQSQVKEEGLFTWDITIPANTTATVYVPGKNITEGGSPAEKAQGVSFIGMDKNRAAFKIESGNYRFTSKNEISQDHKSGQA
jgi:alpha-L-rhamnosidase